MDTSPKEPAPSGIDRPDAWRAACADAACAVLFVALCLAGSGLLTTLRVEQRLRIDAAELGSVKYGLLNADVWVRQISAIADHKLRTLHMTSDDRLRFKKTVERILGVLIDEVDRHLRKVNASGTWLQKAKGEIKQSIQDTLIDMDDVKAAIPEYAERILDELETPAAKADLYRFFDSQLNRAAMSTFGGVDMRRIHDIRRLYDCADTDRCHGEIANRMDRAEYRSRLLFAATLCLYLAIFLAARRPLHSPRRLRLALLLGSTAVLLACGVLAPMIDIEAKISDLRFMLLGEPIQFTEQVLYFQSKSVLDVVEVLIDTHEADMILVGVLLVAFSVVFPLAKLLASYACLFGAAALRGHPIVRFFAYRSGKWSMADVMVIAMFMAYIGFNGIISSQLSRIGAAAPGQLEILTTNGTALRTGFYMFLSFCIASLLVASMLESAVAARGDAQPKDV
ncbi:MAG: paraquat-inducible protein A [Gammaproteobacteria bacterium]